MAMIVQKDAAAEVSRLRAQLERVQGRRLDAPLLPTLPALAALLPGGGLRAGSSYRVASSALLLSLLAAPSRAGSWCAVVGMPELGAEAARDLGVELSRLVVVPEPGQRWLGVAATLAEVMTVVAVRPSGRVSEAEGARLQARLRDRGAALLVQGAWPQAEAVLEVAGTRWRGLGRGYGYLAAREVTIEVRARRSPAPRRARMLLPDANGALVATEQAPPAAAAVTEDAASPGLRAVG